MNEQAQQLPPVKTRRGCLFYGCLGGLAIMLLVLLGGLVGMRLAKRMFNDFTDDKPASLPAPKLTPTETAQVRLRVEDFRNSLRGGTSTGPLSLSAEELNGLIATDPDLGGLRHKLYVTGMKGDRVTGQISIPMEEAGLPMFRGRYLNATGTFNVSVHNGLIRLTAQDLAGKGRPLPKMYMDQIRSQNLAKSFNGDPRVAAAMDWLQSVEVKDGKLMIVPKEKPPQ